MKVQEDLVEYNKIMERQLKDHEAERKKDEELKLMKLEHGNNVK